MWDRVLDNFLRSVIREGALRLHWPDGRTTRYGATEAQAVGIRLADPALARQIVLAPEMGLGEGYMDGRLTVDNDDIYGFLAVGMRNFAQINRHWVQTPLTALRWIRHQRDTRNPAWRSRRNVAHHYDLGDDLYQLFLDRDRQYSCAYFRTPDMTLDAAQNEKKAHIAKKLRLEPGMTVLDIGCGWGGMALTLARDHGVRVLGITLSEEQLRTARARADKAGLSGQVEFRLTDYRAVSESFDRVVSVGMFEHVGVPHYGTYFDKIRTLLRPEGVALVHTIGRNQGPGITSPWISKYIFPGGYVPALSQMVPRIERADLCLTDLEVWRFHYAETLRHWRDRFEAREAEARAMFDARFCRMWRYYLAACEVAFRYGRHCVFQVQLARRQDAVPLTRDYMAR